MKRNTKVLLVVGVLVLSVFAVALAVDISEVLYVKRALHVDASGAVLYGNASWRGEASFEAGAVIDTIVNTKFEASDIALVSWVHASVTAADSANAVLSTYIKADTLFVKRTSSAIDSTSSESLTYGYLVVK